MPKFFYSAQDPAGVNMASKLEGKVDLVRLERSVLEAEEVDGYGFDVAVFLSKHRSASGKECFTVHPTGNFGSAGHGGKQGELSMASAEWMHRFYLALLKTGNVFREATHHGPLLEKPSLFVEIGSDEAAWKKGENAEAIASAVLDAVERKDSGKVAIGFGGTHYCTSFAPLFGEYAFSHVASKHSLDFVTKELVGQMVSRTLEKVDLAFIDWKGCSKEQRDKIIPWIEGIGLEWEKV
ncbi:D-aminoacyl-tRNA deacylase [Candidatus Micrarchaeota archaeon]|nr:D-aminoacyl-tRNA deacylase [Candidatus Micrarchaeota archaeon]